MQAAAAQDHSTAPAFAGLSEAVILTVVRCSTPSEWLAAARRYPAIAAGGPSLRAALTNICGHLAVIGGTGFAAPACGTEALPHREAPGA
jgi:hypothetical protein